MTPTNAAQVLSGDEGHPVLAHTNINKPRAAMMPLIHEILEQRSESESRHFADGFTLTDQGRYAGMAKAQDLLRAITQMQIEAARYANPLTMLSTPLQKFTHVFSSRELPKPSFGIA